MNCFSNFVAIDWSGARGERHKGIALALADLDGGPPRLLQRGKAWSRDLDVHTFLRDDLPDDTLVGMDLGISLPFEDCAAFFPGWEGSPPDARALWTLVDAVCANDPHLEATSFVDHPQLSRYFRRHGAREGDRFRDDGAVHGRGRFRVTEHAQAAMGCKPYSNFNLVGAAQVGKSSLTGMRLLHQLDGALPVWPIDPLPREGSVLVEIYTSLAALEAQRSSGRSKIRSYEELDTALDAIGSPGTGQAGAVDARTEGWTFGAR